MFKYFKEAINNYKRYKTIMIDSTAIIVLALFLLGSYLFIAINLSNIINNIKDNTKIVAFLEDSVMQDERDEIITKIKSMPQVKQLVFISKDEALEEFIKDPQIKKEVEILETNPLPSSFHIKLHNNYYKDIGLISAKIGALDGLEGVRFGEKKINYFSKLLLYTNVIGALIGFICLFITSILLRHISRITVHYHDTEISLMFLLGATVGFIKKTFVAEGILIGGLASCIVIFVIGISYLIATVWIKDIVFLTAPYLAGILFAGIILGVFSRTFAIKKCIV